MIPGLPYSRGCVVGVERWLQPSKVLKTFIIDKLHQCLVAELILCLQKYKHNGCSHSMKCLQISLVKFSKKCNASLINILIVMYSGIYENLQTPESGTVVVPLSCVPSGRCPHVLLASAASNSYWGRRTHCSDHHHHFGKEQYLLYSHHIITGYS